MKCFLIAAPKKPAVPFAISERVNIHTSLGRPVAQSCLLTGLLIEDGGSLSDGEVEALVDGLRDRGGEIVTALFGISLAGDLPDGKSANFIIWRRPYTWTKKKTWETRSGAFKVYILWLLLASKYL